MERIEHIRHLTDEMVELGVVESRSFAREAVRVVMMDKNGRVALMHVGKYGIYKLPGGGIFGDEDLGEALDREICEETGHELTDVVKLGITTENREKGDLLQISHCYLAKGLHRGEPRYSPDELEEGFSLFWAKDLGEAINLVGTSESERYDDTYIRERDAAILITAKQYLTNQQQKK